MKITHIDELPFYREHYISSFNRKVNLPYIRATVDSLPLEVDAIFATSDLQGKPDNRSRKLLGEEVAENILALVHSLCINPSRIGILLCGDFCADTDRYYKNNETLKTWISFAAKFKWVIGVAGNHDIFDNKHFISSERIKLLDGQVFNVGKCRIGGIGGIIGSVEKINRKSETNYIELLEGTLAQSPDILLLHDGPDLPRKKYIGVPSVRQSLEKVHSDVLVIRGHKHWENAFEQLSNFVQVLNVNSRVVMLVTKDFGVVRPLVVG